MKKVARVAVSLICLAVAIFFIFGREAIPANETAKAFYDLAIYQDGTGVKKFDITEKDIEEMFKEFKSNNIKDLKVSFKTLDLNVSDDNGEKIYNGIVNSLKKLKSNIEIVSSDNGITKVKVITDYINVVDISKNSMEEAIKELKGRNYKNNDIMELYTKKFVEKIKVAQPEKNKKEKVFDFKKERIKVNGLGRSTWVPEKISQYTESLIKLATGEE